MQFELHEELARRWEQKFKGALKELREVEQILGAALGYPLFSDYPQDWPEATPEDGICIFEHTAVTLAMEAAATLDRFGQASREKLSEKAIAQIFSNLQARRGALSDVQTNRKEVSETPGVTHDQS